MAGDCSKVAYIKTIRAPTDETVQRVFAMVARANTYCVCGSRHRYVLPLDTWFQEHTHTQPRAEQRMGIE
eukprot:16427454-Heterocapsa_arctica.AAC.1